MDHLLFEVIINFYPIALEIKISLKILALFFVLMKKVLA
jgi:hypothetical protein